MARELDRDRAHASGSADHTARIWDIRTGKARHTLKGHAGPILSISFDPDGATLATGSQDGTIKIWNAASGKLVSTFASHNAPAIAAHEAEDAEPALPRVHVVHNGDTLGRLAKRYLGDERRSLEIFDLNRDVLTNPHLLPIGAELRLPADSSQAE